jgi:hypothetical protein
MDGKDELDLYRFFKELFNSVLKMDPKSAQYSAYYYVTYIQNYPTNFSAMQKLLSNKINGLNKGSLSSCREHLLASGLIAEILSKTDSDVKRETYLPIGPEILLNLYKDDFTSQFGQASISIDELIKTYDDKFKLENLIKNTKLFGKDNSGYLPLYYSGKWVLYMILSYANAGNDLLWGLSGSRYNEYKYFRDKILGKGVNIKILFGMQNAIDLDKSNISGNNLEEYGSITVQHIPLNNYGTGRITVLKDFFALDGKKLLPNRRSGEEPSYIGILYLNKEDIEVLNDGFINVWNLLKNHNPNPAMVGVNDKTN